MLPDKPPDVVVIAAGPQRALRIHRDAPDKPRMGMAANLARRPGDVPLLKQSVFPTRCKQPLLMDHCVDLSLMGLPDVLLVKPSVPHLVHGKLSAGKACAKPSVSQCDQRVDCATAWCGLIL